MKLPKSENEKYLKYTQKHKYITHLKFLNIFKQNIFNIYSDCLTLSLGKKWCLTFLFFSSLMQGYVE